MVFCSSCGNEETLDKKFCSKCGSELTIHSKIEEITKDHLIIPTPKSKWYYLVPVFFGLIGGICTYFFLRKEDPKLAKNCLILGIVLTIIYPLTYGMFSELLAD